jgi:hypothetical protein
MNIFESILLGDETRGPGGQKNGKACKSLPSRPQLPRVRLLEAMLPHISEPLLASRPAFQ